MELYKIYKEYPVITTDSRTCPKDSIFFALKGGNFDGNAYAKGALEKGCRYAVVDEKEYAQEGDDRYILVDDVLKALQDLAAYHREQLTIPVIQITGTNGKTTTKELVSAVLGKKFNTVYTQGNLNNHIGVPRTLLTIRPEHEIAVIETGANHPGEIEFLCRMVKADCGLITNVGRAHLEGFGSFEGVKKTKGELYDDLKARQKFIFLNMQDMDLVQMSMKREMRIVPYVQGVAMKSDSPFLKVRWMSPGNKVRDIQTKLIGAYNLPNVLAAVTVGLHFGVSEDKICEALEEYTPTNNRSEFRKTERNSLIVDAYNANATSMNAALDSFSEIVAADKMVILGDMRELGAESQKEHQNIIEHLSRMNLSEIWLVGGEFSKVDFGKLKCPVTRYNDVEEVKSRLQETPINGRLILVKGSNGTRLYQLPELL